MLQTRNTRHLRSLRVKVHRKAVEDSVDYVLYFNKAVKIKIHDSYRPFVATFEDEGDEDN